MQLSLVDVIAVLFVLLLVVLSWRRGLAQEIGHLAGSIAAFVLGWIYHREVGEWLVAHTRLTGDPARVAAFIGTVLVVILVSFVITLLLSRLIKQIIPEGIDHVGGAVAGLIKGSVYVLLIFLVLNMWPHEYLNRHFGEESLIGTGVLKILPSVKEKLQELNVREKVQETVRDSQRDVERVLNIPEAADGERKKRKWFSGE